MNLPQASRKSADNNMNMGFSHCIIIKSFKVDEKSK